jgi:hypothetical protein
MKRHSPRTRDVALNRMRRVKRLVVAGSLVLTGVLTDLAAQAFPGHTVKRAALAPPTTPARGAARAHRVRSHHRLRPPAHHPRVHNSAPVAPVQSAPVQSAPVQSAPAQSAPVQSAPAQSAPVQSAPAQSAPVQSAPVQSAPAPAPAPVVSGGS